MSTMTNGKEYTRENVQTIVPAVNIVETRQSYILALDIPGANKDDIKAQIEDNTLTVSASVSDYFPHDKELETLRRYHREFSLANDIDLGTVDAQYDLGVLTVTLHKKQQYLPKQITIN